MDGCRWVLFGLLLWQSGFAANEPLQLKQVKVNGTPLAYVESGQGDPIVFIHGELQDYRAWQPQLEFFSKDFRTIAYSRRNHYPNERTKEGVADSAAEEHCTDLAAFIVSLGLGRAHIVAHSSGAHAALFLAAMYPEMVQTLVVSEPPAIGVLRFSPLGLTMYRNLETKLLPSKEAFRNGQLTDGVRLYMNNMYGADSYKRLAEEDLRSVLDNVMPQVADALATESPALFECEMAGRITAPTLIVTGSRSLPLYQRIGEELSQCLSNNKHEQIEISATHAGPMDNPKAFDKAVRSFLRKSRTTT